eukprot:3551341-Alexandrium_andersonii.AAC.1
MPALHLLPDPGDDAGHLVREDVHHQLLAHPGPAAFTCPRVLVPEDAVDPLRREVDALHVSRRLVDVAENAMLIPTGARDEQGAEAG